MLAAAALIAPAMARENHAASRYVAQDRDAYAAPGDAYAASGARYVDGRLCYPAPRVGAFATAPWTGDNVPCAPVAAPAD
jgi:hypothetical protein